MTMTTTAGDTAPSAPRHAAPERGGRRTSLATLALHAAGSLLALALLPICLALDVPFAGWAIGAGAVVANRLVHGVVAHAVRDASLTVVLGALGFSTMFRALLTALVLFFVGAQVGASGDAAFGLNRPDLARPAIIVFLLCFTLDAGIETIRRASEKERLTALDHASAATNSETTA